MVDSREPERLVPRLQELQTPLRLVIGAVPHQGGISAEQIAILGARVPRFALDSVPGRGTTVTVILPIMGPGFGA